MESTDHPFEPSQEARELYKTHVSQAWTDQQASSDLFDSNLLKMSSAALGLSLIFLKDIVPLEEAEWMKILYTSWAAFAGCILVTIASFRFAIEAQKAHASYLREYYLNGRTEYFDKKSAWSKAIPWCALMGSMLLLVGIVLTVLFAANNVQHLKEMKNGRQQAHQSTRAS